MHSSCDFQSRGPTGMALERLNVAKKMLIFCGKNVFCLDLRKTKKKVTFLSFYAW